MTNCECFFCKNQRFSLNRELSLPSDDSIIFQDNNIFITPDLFPLVEGHFLIVTKEHFASLGSCPNSVIDSVERGMQFLGNNVFAGHEYTFFEHGAVVEHTGGSCIDHAHIHALPCVWNLKDKIESSPFITSSYVKCDRATLTKMAQNKTPYLFLYEKGGEPVTFPVGKLPSQFMRIIIANELGIDYNWKNSYHNRSSTSLFLNTLKLYRRSEKE